VADAVILDTSAILALTGDEPGADEVQKEMVRSLMQEINTSSIAFIPDSLQSSFRGSLLGVIQDVPIEISASKIRLTAHADGSITARNLAKK
jgi:PIN domain nuclease of toxin-antitoxin system